MTARHSLSPYSLLSGFVLLLAALFGVAYAVGSAAGPVSPGMHRTGGGSASEPGSGHNGGGGGGNGGGGMDGMPGMGH
ncbi:hypothetical protein J7W19_04495 [Streptomyces mobaraensis NBRC 13819 = DSM 40847]|uniref:Uncharacterized protein n=2 Tax=Streptomyces mobaraensis TaxID=35621 RepID=A0A5N5W042_STRMB|nr:hypothetical protein [Streptomyces mobaraensis]EME97414.1 hypothetical protein H340_26651 [Streptomyces mobaraensis NBRC 13819 = DSM 40847]KAB7834768.1 hypothetical protein FRZ00_28425 [Streptomyces mobaraensis]QTT72792.1 hypothetical protein J7W19_04495 [Streptomyces mobaraensis NBRC 13819 = DSM 40847]